jgi:hypothetical protein
LDYVAIDLRRNRALIIDYKTGRKESQAVADNLQLRTQAVLLHNARPSLQSISAAIVEPWVSWSPERVEYDSKALAKARAEIQAIVIRADFRAGERNAGPWCEHCAARAYCAEAREYVGMLYRIGIERATVPLPVGEKGSRIIEEIKTVREILDAMEAAYKVILAADPNALSDHFLHDGKRSRSISNIQEAKFRLKNAGLDENEIDSCATFWISKLERQAKELHHVNVDAVLADLITESIGEPYIAKLSVKERKRRQLGSGNS